MPNTLMLGNIPHIYCQDCHRWEIWGTGIHTAGNTRAERLLHEYEHTTKGNQVYLYQYIKQLLNVEEAETQIEQPSHSSTKSEYKDDPNANKTQEEGAYEKAMQNEDVLIEQCRTMLTAHFPDFTNNQIDVIIAVVLMIKRGG